MKPQVLRVQLITKSVRSESGTDGPGLNSRTIVGIVVPGLRPIMMPTPKPGIIHALDHVMPVEMARRFHAFASRNYIHGHSTRNGFDSRTFMLYMAGLDPRPTGMCGRLHFNGEPVRVSAIQPHQPYLMQRTSEAIAEGAIGLAPNVCMTVLPVPEFVIVDPELVIVRASHLMRAYELDVLTQVTEARRG